MEAKGSVVAGAESPEVVEVRKPRPSSEQMDAQLKAQVQEDGTVKMSLTGATVYDVGPAGELLGKREIESPPPLRKTPSPPQDDEEVITVSGRGGKGDCGRYDRISCKSSGSGKP